MVRRQPPRLSAPLTALALALGALACATAPDRVVNTAAPSAAGISPADYYPLAVGTAWTYEVRGGGRTTRDTVKIIGQDGPWFLDDHRGRLRLEADGVRDRDRYLLRAPLTTGKTWSAVEQMVVQRFEVAATDAAVTVPAGRFERCVVIRNEQAIAAGGRYVTEWTYAPGVGLIALKTRAVQGGKEQEQTSLQLYRFDKAAP